MSTIINATTTNGVVIQPDNSGSLELQTNSGTTALTIDTSQNVGIGTASPSYKFQTTISGNTTAARFTNGTTITDIYCGATYSYVGSAGANNAIKFDGTNNIVGFDVNATERMRITSGGEVYIAGTTDRGAFNLQCNGTGVWGAGAYTNGSDERIKDNITPLDTGLDVVAKLNPVTYKYKEEWSRDQSIQTGFIAQDLIVALEGKNYVDGIVNQSSEYMSVAYQNIIPILTKAIQEQQTIINDLKARVETLEGAKLG
jgi:hypothetical protein